MEYSKLKLLLAMAHSGTVMAGVSFFTKFIEISSNPEEFILPKELIAVFSSPSLTGVIHKEEYGVVNSQSN
jgi:hypothetical protein